MSEPTVDVLAVMDELIDVPVIECLEDQEFVDTAKIARAAVVELVAERDALRWALSEYPKRNPHQLQARKVCEGVAALARFGGAS